MDSAVTARIRSGWNKFRELQPLLTSKAPSLKMKGTVYAACVRSCMTYGSETWAMKADQEDQMEKAEMRMIRWMSGSTLKDRRTSRELREQMGLENIRDVLRRARLRWFGHVRRMEDSNNVKKVTELIVEGKRPAGRPRVTWKDVVSADIRSLHLNEEDADNRASWRHAIKVRLK